MDTRGMKKLFLFIIFLLTCSLAIKAQSIQRNEELEKQLRSIEVGPWDFAPDWFYYFLHKDYSGAEKFWKWRGFKSGYRVRFVERKSNVKRVMPVRVAEDAVQRERLKAATTEYDKVNEVYKEELIREADRTVDLMYANYKDDFNKMQDQIADGLSYCMKKSKGKMARAIKEVTSKNEVLCEGISYIHKTGVGYELENSKRQKAYIEIKKEMQELVKRTLHLCLFAEANF
ncbi:hypothetical protein HMPREF9431_00770 [Segatella oulorum F0390]|uniref:DUF5045 domain-containing protein n=2 Tax=Segatella oulorum TaxID=28136 RepID=G1WAC5_9BACT|nr:hypothetical protein HMPREF9431_00770 [Segatella oulorum F0390]